MRPDQPTNYSELASDGNQKQDNERGDITSVETLVQGSANSAGAWAALETDITPQGKS